MRYVTEPTIRSRPVQWYLLIQEVERFNAVTGWGMATVWKHIHREHYDEAVQEFEGVKARWLESLSTYHG